MLSISTATSIEFLEDSELVGSEVDGRAVDGPAVDGKGVGGAVGSVSGVSEGAGSVETFELRFSLPIHSSLADIRRGCPENREMRREMAEYSRLR